jgi:hypothetical protein
MRDEKQDCANKLHDLVACLISHVLTSRYGEERADAGVSIQAIHCCLCDDDVLHMEHAYLINFK